MQSLSEEMNVHLGELARHAKGHVEPPVAFLEALRQDRLGSRSLDDAEYPEACAEGLQ